MLSNRRGTPPEMKHVSRQDVRPLYKQVKDRLLETLSDGSLPPMGKPPSERERVEQSGVPRIPVPQAMRELVAEGPLRSPPGKGFSPPGPSPAQAFELELLRSFPATA